MPLADRGFVSPKEGVSAHFPEGQSKARCEAIVLTEETTIQFQEAEKEDKIQFDYNESGWVDLRLKLLMSRPL